MSGKRMLFGLMALAVYTVLGIAGFYLDSPATADGDARRMAAENGAPAKGETVGGSAVVELGVEWQSFLPGAFK